MNLNLIFIFIIIDYIKLFTLWDENIFRRIFHHFQNSEYNPRRIPYLFQLNKLNLLSINNIETIKYIFDITIKNICTNKISPLLSLFGGGNYSNRCTLYYNDFNNSNKKLLDEIGNNMIPYFEKLINKKLKLGNSDFRCVILSYEGENANFSWHYDTEHSQCYRTLFLFDSHGNISPFAYIDEKDNKNIINLEIGDGIFFRGTTTYHGVEKSIDNNQIRRMVGWQYIEDPILEEEKKSFCSELRSKSFLYIMFLFSLYAISFAILINAVYNVIPIFDINNNYIYLFTFLVIIYFLLIIKYKLSLKLLIKYFLVCLISSGLNIEICILLLLYIIITEKIIEINS